MWPFTKKQKAHGHDEIATCDCCRKAFAKNTITEFYEFNVSEVILTRKPKSFERVVGRSSKQQGWNNIMNGGLKILDLCCDCGNKFLVIKVGNSETPEDLLDGNAVLRAVNKELTETIRKNKEWHRLELKQQEERHARGIDEQKEKYIRIMKEDYDKLKEAMKNEAIKMIKSVEQKWKNKIRKEKSKGG